MKTARRDAAKLARRYGAWDLTPVWGPDAAHEALRDLICAREDAREDQQRAPAAGQDRGVTVVAEVGSLSRFANPRQSMSYGGMVSSEYSSGSRIRGGGITKPDNAHLRRVTVEAAWAYQHKLWMGGWPAKRQHGLDEETKAIARKAQWRLCMRSKKLAAKGENTPQIVAPIGRQLLGFPWAIGVRAEARCFAASG